MWLPALALWVLVTPDLTLPQPTAAAVGHVGRPHPHRPGPSGFISIGKISLIL